MKNEHIIDIEEVLSRGVEALYPSQEEVVKRFKETPQTLYFGIDPTGPTLHLGHITALKKLGQLQKLGHKIVFLIGDFTAMIGDPTDKSAVRVQLTHEEVLANEALYKEQASLFLNFEGDNPVEIRHNSEWLSKMDFSKVLELSSSFTVQEMLKRDMFRRRIEDEKPIFVHEFMYPLMQGYDSVAMDIDAEIGGNDQTFNMLAGRSLMKKMSNKDKMVISLELLVDPTGKKMGKTEGNMVTFTDTPQDVFGKVMSWSDEMIIPALRLCTYMPLDEVQKREEALDSGENPRDVKVELALLITSMLCGDSEAERARDEFESTFSGGGIPETIPSVQAQTGDLLVDVLLREGVVDSKSDFRRLVDQGAITNLNNEEKIESYEYALEKTVTLKIGKKRFVEVLV